jgi:ATP-dependent DNA ligase
MLSVFGLPSIVAYTAELTAPGDGRTVLDGEIVCLDRRNSLRSSVNELNGCPLREIGWQRPFWMTRGRPQFNDLLFHRGEPCFFAFDILMDDGKDLRSERLTDRKHELRRLLSKAPTSRMLYVEHIEQYGTALFQQVCKMDLEGIVAKHSFGNYVTEHERTTWFKIKNRNYSQMAGREKLFERERHREPVPGWHCCELACEESD